jgi:hypothetical protein
MKRRRQRRLVLVVRRYPGGTGDSVLVESCGCGWTVPEKLPPSRLRRAIWTVLHPPRLLWLRADCATLSDGTLARRWRLTYDAVTSGRASVRAQLALVAERQLLLDELERRHQRTFQEWLSRDGWTSSAESDRHPGQDR